MQVFNTFLKILKKNAVISMIYLIIFVVICVMTAAQAADASDYTAQKLNVAIIDLDKTDTSRALSDFIGEHHNIKTVENDKDTMLDALFYMEIDAVIEIHNGFSEALMSGKTNDIFSCYSSDGTYKTQFFKSQVESYISMANAEIRAGRSASEALSHSAELSRDNVKVNIMNFSSASAENGNDNTSGYFFQYLAYILISVMITALGPTLTTMTQKDIGNRTNCSCIRSTSFLGQLVAGSSLFTVAVYAVLIIVAIAVYGKALLSYNGLLSILNGFVFLIFSMVLTLLIAVISPSKTVINVIANVVGLGMSFICGIFVPQELLGEGVRNFGKFFPAYWYVKANNMLAGFSGEVFKASEYTICIIIELAFSAAVLCVTLLVSKQKRSSDTI